MDFLHLKKLSGDTVDQSHSTSTYILKIQQVEDVKKINMTVSYRSFTQMTYPGANLRAREGDQIESYQPDHSQDPINTRSPI
jgi:hypothetical protein